MLLNTCTLPLLPLPRYQYFFVDNTKLYNLHVLNGYHEKTGSYNLASLSKIIKPPSSRAKIPVQTFIASKPTILPLYHSETQIRSPSLNCYTLYLYLFIICQNLSDIIFGVTVALPRYQLICNHILSPL